MVFHRPLDDKKCHFEFSKVLALGISALFALAVCFCAAVWCLWSDIPEALMNYVDGPFMVVVSAYMVKSGAENVIKIREAGDRQPEQ